MKTIAIGMLFVSQAALAGEATLTLRSGEVVKRFTQSELLRHPKAKDLVIPKDPAHADTQQTKRAVPAAELFAELLKDFKIADDANLQFKCLDGFSAPIAAGRVLRAKKSRAWIAVEDPAAPWPKIPGKEQTPGPFYLVWEHPEGDGISREEWPFQLESFEVRPGLRAQFPKIFPKMNLAADHPVMKGLKVFAKNCFACHKMNGAGEGTMGPDLNLPMNPTEYFQPAALRKLIRNPRSVRAWPENQMTPFPENVLSEADLTNLLAYLAHMKSTRQSYR
jgi:mono/diheme cytochrome c family protein